MCNRRWWHWHAYIFKFFLVVLVIVVTVGEIGCFWLCFLTWRIPHTSSDSLNLLFVSDSQIQGYKGESSGILGYITRLDSDWYLRKAFYLALRAFSPDAVIHLGDVLDEGFIATAEEFQEYKTRHDTFFNTPAGICRIHIAGDNDIGGEGNDIITKEKASRFSENFGPLNDVIKLKSAFQIVKVNTVSLLRRRPLTSEWAIYNNTIAFIDDLPSKLDRDRTSILIGHVPLTYTNEKQVVPIIKLVEAVQPHYAFSGHIHKAATFYHKIGTVTFAEHVVPTCSYRMGTGKMGVAVAVLGVDGSIDFSALPLPTRYPYFYTYLGIVCICMVLALQWLLSPMAILVKTALNGALLLALKVLF